MEKQERLGDWLLERARREQKEVLDILAAVLWSIWTTRNNHLFRCWEPDPLTTAKQASSLLNSYNEARWSDLTTIRPRCKWSPLQAPWLKVNMDAAFLGNHR